MTMIVAALAFSLVLAACQGGGDSAGGDEDSVDLVVWFARDYYEPSDSFASLMDEYPHLNIRTDIIRDEDQLEQMLRMAQANQRLPDIVQIDGFLAPALAEANLIQDISPIVEAWAADDPDSFNQLADVVWEQGVWDGVQYGMADRAAMEFIFYRSDWFDEEGIEAPFATWEDGIAAARILKDRGVPSPWGLKYQQGEGINLFIGHLSAAGVSFEGSVPNLDSPEGLAVVEWYQTVLNEGLMSGDAAAWGPDEYLAEFVSGRSAITMTDLSSVSDFSDAGFQLGQEYDIFPLPLASGGGHVAGARNFFLTSDVEDLDAAGLVFRHLASEAVSLEMTIRGGEPPFHAAVLENEQFLGLFEMFSDEGASRHSEIILEAFFGGDPFPIGKSFLEVEPILEEFQQDMIRNPGDPAAEVVGRHMPALDAIDD